MSDPRVEGLLIIYSFHSSTLSRTEACRRDLLPGGGKALPRPLRCCCLVVPGGGEFDERDFLLLRSGDVAGAGVADRREERRRVGPSVAGLTSSPVSDTTLEARPFDDARDGGFP